MIYHVERVNSLYCVYTYTYKVYTIQYSTVKYSNVKYNSIIQTQFITILYSTIHVQTIIKYDTDIILQYSIVFSPYHSKLFQYSISFLSMAISLEYAYLCLTSHYPQQSPLLLYKFLFLRDSGNYNQIIYPVV